MRDEQYYQALINRDERFEGLFFVGVKTTGIFCRPTCPARKPKKEHCKFFECAQDALLAAYRPCKRCQPLSHPDRTPDSIRMLVDLVEKNPEKRWTNQDIREHGFEESTIRRQFKKQFGMTFIEYARSRRIGLAMKEIKEGKPVLEAQITSGYESSSGFRDAFSKIMGKAPASGSTITTLFATWIDTNMGAMLAVSDEKEVYLLEFLNRRGLEKELERLRRNAVILPGKTEPIRMLEVELEAYFQGALYAFQTPIKMIGSPFQQLVWKTLRQIPYGSTISYQELAASIGRPNAYRAVANANGANQLAILIPCHRVIRANGELGGYGGGVNRKEALISLEKQERSKVDLP